MTEHIIAEPQVTDVPVLTERVDIDETWQPAVLGHASVGPSRQPEPALTQVALDPPVQGDAQDGPDPLVQAVSEAILAELAQTLPALVAAALERARQGHADRLESMIRPD